MAAAGAELLNVRFENGVSVDEPYLDGHFPGDPIVPGAALLGHAAEALRTRGLEVAEIVRVKFLRPLRPEQPFEIAVSGDTGSATVVWRDGAQPIAQARVRLRARSG